MYSYLFLLSSAVSAYLRISFLSLGELFYILRKSRILSHFTTLLNGKHSKEEPLLSSEKVEMMIRNIELYLEPPNDNNLRLTFYSLINMKNRRINMKLLMNIKLFRVINMKNRRMRLGLFLIAFAHISYEGRCYSGGYFTKSEKSTISRLTKQEIGK